jgi:hypothetical protein
MDILYRGWTKTTKFNNDVAEKKSKLGRWKVEGRREHPTLINFRSVVRTRMREVKIHSAGKVRVGRDRKKLEGKGGR